MAKGCLVVVLSVALVGQAAGDDDLRRQVREASACSDATLEDYAAHTCESPEQIAAMAVAKCRTKWDAVAAQAIGAPSTTSSPKEQSRTLKNYSEAMEYEYVRMAELKAIEMRTAAGRCGFE